MRVCVSCRVVPRREARHIFRIFEKQTDDPLGRIAFRPIRWPVVYDLVTLAPREPGKESESNDVSGVGESTFRDGRSCALASENESERAGAFPRILVARRL